MSQTKITLWGIEVFATTAQEASITAAARRLGASAATVSQQLTNLEAAVGTTLLDRGARPVALTPAGDMFLRRANTILNEAEQAQADLKLSDMSRMTRFRLGMIEDFDADVTPALLAEMGAELKNCRFLLETGASHRLADLLETRALDLIVAADIGQYKDTMVNYPLMVEPFVAVVPRGSIKGDDPARALRDMPLIHYTTRQYMGRMIADHLTQQDLNLNRRFELDSYHAIMAMVAQGAGWTIMTPLGWMRAERFRAQVDVIPLPFAPLSRSISLTARREVLGELPGDIAARLRPQLQTMVVDPAIKALPWLGGDMCLL
jgi:DNA-binding transcriptional LysR family regulator